MKNYGCVYCGPFDLDVWRILHKWSFHMKGVGLRTCRISLVNRQKIKVLDESGIALFCVLLCAEHFYIHEQHLFSCVTPLLLCCAKCELGRHVLTLFGLFYVFDRKFDKGHSHFTK